MTKFVWVFGSTAVGKDTLISRIANEPDHPFISRFKMEGPLLVQQNALVERHQERDPLELKIASDRERAKSILIKGQGHDIGQRTIFKLQEMLPNDQFIYIFLDASPDIIRQRREQRGSPGPGWDDVNDRAINLRMIKELETQGIEFVWFDNSGDTPEELAVAPEQ